MRINSQELRIGSVKLYDKHIKNNPILSREEEYSIFVSFINTKKAMIEKLLEDINIFSLFKIIVSKYIDNDNLLDAIYFEPDIWEDSTTDEIVDYYSMTLNSIKYSNDYFSVRQYTSMINYTHEIYEKLLDVLTPEMKKDNQVDVWVSVISSIKNRIVEHNLAMAMEIALKNRNVLDISLDDAIQCSMIGLSIAVDKHNPFLKTKLSTSAYSWIYQNIQRYNDNHRSVIQIPANIIEDSKKNNKVISNHLKKNEYFPTHEEVCESAGNDSYVICNNSYDSIDGISSNNSNGNTIAIKDKLKDENIQDIGLLLEFSEMSTKIKDIINKLDNKEKQLVSLLFGIGSENESHTHKKIMEIMNIDNNAFNKLKKSAFNSIKDQVDEDSVFNEWYETFKEGV